MTLALILKELRQHWFALLLVAGLATAGLVVLTAGIMFQPTSGSMFDALAQFMWTIFVVATLVVCNRLVVLEYQSKTQLFLQSLPISRLHMIVVKYFLGLLLLASVVTLAFGAVLVLSARTEELTVRFALILAARTALFAWCVYSGFFMMGLLGRYRVAIYLVAIVGVFALDTLTKLDVGRFGPFALLDDQFGYERVDWPAQAMLVTLVLTTAFIIATFILSLVREGSVASLLAESMSHREKVFIAVLLIGLIVSVTVIDKRAAKLPFDLPGALAEEAGAVTVKVSLGASADEERGRRLAKLVAREVNELQEYLRVEQFPPIFIVQRRDLDAERFERGVLDGAEGLLIRANFLNGEWQDGRFLSWLVRELLVLASDDRVKFEPNRWVLDGFALYWICHDKTSKYMNCATLDLRAAYGMQRGFTSDDAAHWLSYRERVGEDIAAAVAWAGLISLRSLQGESACRKFLQAMLDCNQPGDVRSVWHQWQHPLPKVLAREAGLTYEQFTAVWSNGLEARRRSRMEELALIPRLSGTIRFSPTTSSTRIVNFEFKSEPPPEGRFTLIHVNLPPFDHELPNSELRREEFLYKSEMSGELPGSFARGTRFGSTFAVWVDVLGCEIISGWTRQEMR